jgi:hypothetical protein
MLVAHPKIPNHRIRTPAFNRRLSGEGSTFASNERQLTICSICGTELQRKSLKRHMTTKHNNYSRPQKPSKLSTLFNRPSRTYNIEMNPNPDEPTDCPVPLCPGQYKTANIMRTHFNHRHWQDTIIIAHEGPLPQCERCLLFTSNANSDIHKNSQRCMHGHNRLLRREQ